MKSYKLLILILAGAFLFAANNMNAQECPPDNCSFAHECEAAPELKWDTSHSYEIAGSGDSVPVLGGVGPYTWTINGNGFYFAQGTTATTTGTGSVQIFLDAACGSAELTVSDKCCQKIKGSVRSTNGYWRSLQLGRDIAFYDVPVLAGTSEPVSGWGTVIAYAMQGGWKINQYYQGVGGSTVSEACSSPGYGNYGATRVKAVSGSYWTLCTSDRFYHYRGEVSEPRYLSIYPVNNSVGIAYFSCN